LSRIHIGECECEHGTAHIAAPLKGGIDSARETVSTTWKEVGLSHRKFVGPKTAKDKELSIISGKFIGFEQDFTVTYVDGDEDRLLPGGRVDLGESGKGEAGLGRVSGKDSCTSTTRIPTGLEGLPVFGIGIDHYLPVVINYVAKSVLPLDGAGFFIMELGGDLKGYILLRAEDIGVK
jgi:hypothetical protein